jgi:hypothetical protein
MPALNNAKHERFAPLSDRGPDHLRRFHSHEPKASVSHTAMNASQIVGS